jgi:hypothetical protein
MIKKRLAKYSYYCVSPKAALPLERFCPDKSMAPVFGDCVDGGGVALKSVKADPDGEIVKFRRPGRAMLNSTWGS